MVELTERMCRVLRVVQVDACATVPEIARLCGYRQHTVQHVLNSLRQQGIIRRSAFINPYALGNTVYHLFLSFNPLSDGARQDLLKELFSNQHVGTIYELGGDFQFLLRVFAANPAIVKEIIDGIKHRFGKQLRRELVTIVLAYTLIGGKYLWPAKKNLRTLKYSADQQPVQVDELDQRILFALCNENYFSNAEWPGSSASRGTPFIIGCSGWKTRA